jgi:hypothetical protein
LRWTGRAASLAFASSGLPTRSYAKNTRNSWPKPTNGSPCSRRRCRAHR